MSVRQDAINERLASPVAWDDYCDGDDVIPCLNPPEIGSRCRHHRTTDIHEHPNTQENKPMTMTTNAGPDLGFTPEAKTTISAMRDRVQQIGAAFGRESTEFTEAAASLAMALSSMIGLGGNITKDGDLSLYGVNEYIAYGVNWSPKQRGAAWPYDLPGTWSVNS